MRLMNTLRKRQKINDDIDENFFITTVNMLQILLSVKQTEYKAKKEKCRL